MTRNKKLLIVLLALAVLTGGYFLYMAWAFPAERCEAAKHLDSPQMAGDCYACHMKSTPRLAQEWYESKHGITLVRCQTCHGMPDGKGAIPFTRKPGVEVCARCHSLSIQRMEAKFGNTVCPAARRTGSPHVRYAPHLAAQGGPVRKQGGPQ